MLCLIHVVQALEHPVPARSEAAPGIARQVNPDHPPHADLVWGSVGSCEGEGGGSSCVDLMPCEGYLENTTYLCVCVGVHGCMFVPELRATGLIHLKPPAFTRLR